ncbi:hypothetical protein ECZU26_25120 [Escherichia coli]|nr:hypothetical protein ECZU26_25120 [Escherichia coli]
MPVELAEACAHAVMKSGIDLAVSYCMQVDHGFAQPLEFLLGGLDKVPVLPVFINGVATAARFPAYPHVGGSHWTFHQHSQ